MISENRFHGHKVRLTALEIADLAVIARWSENSQFLRLQRAKPAYPDSEAGLREWLAEHQKATNAFLFAIRPKDSDDLLGYIELNDILWTHQVGWLAIGIGNPKHWGHGYGSEAMRLGLQFAFAELNLYRVQLTVFSDNLRAIALYKKMGFQHEGTYRQFLQRDGQRLDMYLYGLLRPEWKTD